MLSYIIVFKFVCDHFIAGWFLKVFQASRSVLPTLFNVTYVIFVNHTL